MKKTLFALLAVLILAALAAILIWAVSYSEAVQVRVAEIQPATLRSSVSTNGKIEAGKVYELRAPFAGICRDIRVQAGDTLKADQPILTVEDPALRSELAAARAELEAAKVESQNIQRGPTKEELNQAEAEAARFRLELENARKALETNEWLLKRDAVSRFDVEQSRREVERLKQQFDAATTRRRDIQSRYTEADRERAAARLEAAGLKLALLEGNQARSMVRAPANGTLYHFELKSGAYVNDGDMIGLFADLSHLRVRAFVDEPELGQVSVGNEVLIQWDAFPREAWKGVVLSIPSEVVTRGTRSVAEVLCSVTSPRPHLIPNVNVDVEIMASDGPEVKSLPRNTVFLEGSSHYVWIVRGGQVVRRTIDAGRATASLIETSLMWLSLMRIPSYRPIR